MHSNPAFRQEPVDRNLAFAWARGFGVLMVNGADGPPRAVSAVRSRCYCRSASGAGQPHCAGRAAVPGVIAVSGPDAYISPNWYGPHDQVPDQVPTWNYVAVHLRGVLEALEDSDLQPHVDALSAAHENRITTKAPWTSAKMSEGAMPRMMRMILPFRLRITAVAGTWKLNQNKPADVRARAAAALAQGNSAAQEIAALMRGCRILGRSGQRH